MAEQKDLSLPVLMKTPKSQLTAEQPLTKKTAAAAAAAKSLQSRPTLCDPRDGSPPCSPVPGILQARILEWVAISQTGSKVGKNQK